MEITPDRRELFERLFAEFATSYPTSKAGEKHVAWYAKARADAREGYDRLLKAEKRGEDITELALVRLLPHNDTQFNRERGAWCTFAPAITKEIKKWFGNSPHIRTDPKAWPNIARALLGFVRRCTEHPAELEAACKEFAAGPHTAGFQAGMLSPILNAITPEDFVLINNKSREVLSFFLDEKLGRSIETYPDTNAKALALLRQLASILTAYAEPELLAGLSPGDRFDMFCHWLVAVKKYPLRDVGYWKIAPGEGAKHWPHCREEGHISIGWDELGDLTGMSLSEYRERRKATQEKHPGWTNAALRQVWRFSRIREGDRIVANKGWSEVVGVGTVTGPYYFVPGVEHGHRLEVEWDDTQRRRISKHGWSMTLAKMDQADFEEVANAPIITDGGGSSRPPPPPLNPPYSAQTLAVEAFQSVDDVKRWVRAIRRKGQVVMYGPPGTGKTFCAERLAKHLVAGGSGFRELVQFHPSYGYEDFVEGIRPRANDDGTLCYPIVPGRFQVACERAAKITDTCVLIIDEINRANLSRVFGELMYLLEYRTKEVPLASGATLRVPDNLLIVGTMNTADRSIALIDHALRRRFAFLRLPPRMDALRRFHEENESFDPAGLIAVLERLNVAIENPNYAVGVSYFMRQDLAEEIGDIWEMEIEPYLEEFFFDRPDRVASFRWTKVAGDVRGHDLP